MRKNEKKMFEVEISKVARLAGQIQKLQGQLLEVLAELSEKNVIFNPDVDPGSVSFEELQIKDDALYRSVNGELQLIANGRSTSVKYDADKKMVLNKVDYFVGRRVGRCKDDLYGTVYAVLDEDTETGRCDVMSFDYKD